MIKILKSVKAEKIYRELSTEDLTLRRFGRFDREIDIGVPDEIGRWHKTKSFENYPAHMSDMDDYPMIEIWPLRADPFS